MKEIIQLPQPQKTEIKLFSKSLDIYNKVVSLIYGNRERDIFNVLKTQIESLKEQGAISYSLEKSGSFEEALKKEVERIQLDITNCRLESKVKINLNKMLEIIENDKLKTFKRNKLTLRKIDKISA